MKKLLLTAILGLSCLYSFAQTEYSDFSAAGRGVATTFETDYHAVGINPANLGFKRKYENKHVTFGLAEVGASAYSGALTKQELRSSIFNFNKPDFTYQQKLKAASLFVNEVTATNLDVNWFGIAYQNDQLGGIAFNIRESARWYSKLNSNFANFMFLGYKDNNYFDKLTLQDGQVVANDPSQYAHYDSIGIKSGQATNPQLYSQLFNGTTLRMLWYREYSLSYGKEFKLNDDVAIAAGVSVKYLKGYGMTQIEYRGNKMTTLGAYSPAFGIDFGTATKFNPSADTSSGLSSAGSGMGFDFGVNLLIKEKIKFGIALTNVGSINWKSNVYSAKDTLLTGIASGGFDSYNVINESEKVISNDGFLKWEGKRKIKTTLPTNLRIGASYEFEERGEIGVDVIIPVNSQPGSLQKPYWAIGGDLRVLRFLKLSAGVAHGGNYDKRVNIPLGVTVIVGEHGSWEFGIASRDAVTYFRDKGPALSVAFGFLRFRV